MPDLSCMLVHYYVLQHIFSKAEGTVGIERVGKSDVMCVFSLKIKGEALVRDTKPQMSYWLFVFLC